MHNNNSVVSRYRKPLLPQTNRDPAKVSEVTEIQVISLTLKYFSMILGQCFCLGYEKSVVDKSVANEVFCISIFTKPHVSSRWEGVN